MTAKAVSVAVRCRSVLPHDKDQRVCVQAVGERGVECLDPEQLHAELRTKHGRQDYLKEKHNRERAYTFDAVFGPAATNADVFQKLAKPLIPEVIAGKHATCFAYGQTGSGKTHTMLGRQGEAGIVEQALHDLLEQAVRASARVVVTFVEVYNEQIRDLLHPKCQVLDLRDDPLRGPCLAGVQEEPASTAEAVMSLVRAGNARRTEETTAANPVSSRSHAVLQLEVESYMPPRLEGGPRRRRSAKLSLVDLAGSERAANTGNKGARLREGAMINRSLLALANCITALTRKGAYVNYRDSKLTRMLKDSLSGNCYTVMAAHVSPSIAAFEETVNTLKYAHRACEIRGLGGGVRANVCEVAEKYADRLTPCLEASRRLQQQVAKLAPPSRRFAPPSRAPPARASRASPSEAPVSTDAASRAVELAEELEMTRMKVVNKLRKQIRIEQTALELEQQNKMNEIELSKLELDVVLGSADATRAAKAGPPIEDQSSDPASVKGQLKLLKMHGALRGAIRKNAAQRVQLEKHSSQVAPSSEGEEEAKLISLLANAKEVLEGGSKQVIASDVERRLLHAQQEMSLIEIEKVEAEQGAIVLEAATRQHEQALRQQQLQLDMHAKALAIAGTVFAAKGLTEEWHAALGPLVQLLPAQHQGQGAPSLDELIAEISEPAASLEISPPGSSRETPADRASDGDAVQDIEDGFGEMRKTLGRSLKLQRLNAEASPGDAQRLRASDEEDFLETLTLLPGSGDSDDEDGD